VAKEPYSYIDPTSVTVGGIYFHTLHSHNRRNTKSMGKRYSSRISSLAARSLAVRGNAQLNRHKYAANNLRQYIDFMMFRYSRGFSPTNPIPPFLKKQTISCPNPSNSLPN